jgi:hypothetical protein
VNAIDWVPPPPYVERQNIVNKQLNVVTLLQNLPNKEVAAKIFQTKGLCPELLNGYGFRFPFLNPNISISV